MLERGSLSLLFCAGGDCRLELLDALEFRKLLGEITQSSLSADLPLLEDAWRKLLDSELHLIAYQSVAGGSS